MIDFLSAFPSFFVMGVFTGLPASVFLDFFVFPEERCDPWDCCEGVGVLRSWDDKSESWTSRSVSSAPPHVSKDPTFDTFDTFAAFPLPFSDAFERFAEAPAAANTALALDRVATAFEEAFITSATSPLLPVTSALGPPTSFLALDAAVLADFFVALGAIFAGFVFAACFFLAKVFDAV
jgi:xanthine/uracil/vitamin C permease (AzgA family)